MQWANERNPGTVCNVIVTVDMIKVQNVRIYKACKLSNNLSIDPVDLMGSNIAVKLYFVLGTNVNAGLISSSFSSCRADRQTDTYSKIKNKVN